jgi:hypothetical protein
MSPRALPAVLLAAGAAGAAGLLLAGARARPAERAAGRPPQVVSVTALAAHPLSLSDGKSGPINRYGFDVLGFAPGGRSHDLVCEYPGDFRYRCAHEFIGETRGLARVVVAIPDLGRGLAVTVRFVNSRGSASARVELTNGPRLVHETESVVLESGGAQRVGGDGQPAPVLNLQQQRARTVPSLAVAGLLAKPPCDDIHAEWLGASATDPVFVSEFGALHGGVVPAAPLPPGARVSEANYPEWLITYPRGATRAHFIAHYEVVYRVGECAAAIVGRS